MDKDIVIAVVLGIAFVSLLAALFGVVGISSYIYLTSGKYNSANADNNPIVDLIDANVGLAASSGASDSNADANKPADIEVVAKPPAPPEPPKPVCGNNIVETGEQCESDADCENSNKACKACKCEDKPKPTLPKLEKLALDSVTFFCQPSFYGKRGLGAKIFTFKNNGTEDFTYTGAIDLSVVVGEFSDSVQTIPSFNFNAKAGKAFDIYPKDMSRGEAPYLFLNTKANLPMKITVKFGEKGYLEYEKTLAFQDFFSVGCE